MRPAATAALLAASLAAAPVQARFAPAPDATYRLTIAATRDDGGTPRRTKASYDIRFLRTATGWRATLTQRSGGDAISAAFRDIPVTLTLDRDGRALAVEDGEAWWARLRAGIVAHAPPAARDAMLAAHDATPAAGRIALLGGDLLAMCAGTETNRRPGARATTIPASDGAVLSARETVHRAKGMVVVQTAADGAIAAGGRATITRIRTIDRRTGLVTDLAETREIATGPRRLRLVSTARLAPLVS